ncbi:MAG: hypothetical protein RLZZ67_599 [Candidatus Parcubacteria bacterium]|jgi:pimeloyl-ACP methyl ester carboxylesterase
MFKKVGKGILWFGLVCILFVVAYYTYLRVGVESNTAESVAPATTQFVTVDTEKIAYRLIDNKAQTTVVFVGGLSGWAGTWERTMQAANAQNKSYNYLSLDLPPFGYSVVDSSKGYLRNVQADRIEGLVKNLGLKSVIVAAHSYGAGPSAEYVLRKAPEVKKFVIIDGVLNIDETKTVTGKGIVQVDYVRNPLIGLLAHSQAFVQGRFKTFVYIKDNITADLIALYMRSFNTEGTTVRLSNWFKDYTNDPLKYPSTSSENYKKLSIPVRMIWGEEDIVTPISLSQVVLDSVPNVKLHTLKKVGHIPMIEDYAAFDTALLEALAR